VILADWTPEKPIEVKNSVGCNTDNATTE